MRIGADEQVGSVAPFFRSIDDRRKRPEAEIGGPKKEQQAQATRVAAVCVCCVCQCVWRCV